jgi:hypothetical protein
MYNRMKRYSNREAAAQLDMSLMTLHRYVRARKIPVPKILSDLDAYYHPWTQTDIERVRKRLPSVTNGRKLKKKAKTKGKRK